MEIDLLIIHEHHLLAMASYTIETLMTIIQPPHVIVLPATETMFLFSATVTSHLLVVDHVPRFALPITIVYTRPWELERNMDGLRITRVTIAGEDAMAVSFHRILCLYVTNTIVVAPSPHHGPSSGYNPPTGSRCELLTSLV
jgi:hypothetical protein